MQIFGAAASGGILPLSVWPGDVYSCGLVRVGCGLVELRTLRVQLGIVADIVPYLYKDGDPHYQSTSCGVLP